MKRPGLPAACALLLVTNVVVLAGVAYNRRGEDARLVLTERELRLGGDWQKENTGMWLRLDTGGVGWRADEPGWFARPKLEELGFDCSVPPDDEKAEIFYGKMLPRRRLAVLEYDGDAWKAWIANREDELLHPKPGTYTSETLEQRRKQLELERVSHSRLFVVDAGMDARALRLRHPDRARTIIADALVRIQLNRTWDEKDKAWKKAYLQGFVSEILVSGIHVPLSRRKILDDVRREQEKPGVVRTDWMAYSEYGYMQAPPRYEVTLVYGRRLEPWVEEIRRLAPPPVPAER